MADVRINNKRMPNLQTVTNLAEIVEKVRRLSEKSNSDITTLKVNDREIDFENKQMLKLKLDPNDIINIKVENAFELSYESLVIAQEMADLLVLDLKYATIKLWESKSGGERFMENLVKDCHLFLSLAAKPMDLLEKDTQQAENDVRACLEELDKIAMSVEDATLLTVFSKYKEACIVLVDRVRPSIEKWLGLSGLFAQQLEVNQVDFSKFSHDLT